MTLTDQIEENLRKPRDWVNGVYQPNWVDIMGITGLALPIIYGGWTKIKQIQELKRQIWPDSLTMHLFTVKQITSNPIQYKIYVYTLNDDKLSNIIGKQPLIMSLQKGFRKCKFDDPFIRIPNKRYHKLILNSVVVNFQSYFKQNWIKKAKNIQITNTENINIDYDDNDYVDSNDLYTFGLMNVHVYERFKYLFYKNGNKDIWNFEHIKNTYIEYNKYRRNKTTSAIRGIMIPDHVCKYFINLYGDDIYNMTNKEWDQLLFFQQKNVENHTHEPYPSRYPLCWDILRKMIQEYDKQEKSNNGHLKYDTMCTMEIPTNSLTSVNKRIAKKVKRKSKSTAKALKV